MNSFAKLYHTNSLIMWIDLSTYCNAACPQCHRTDPNGLKKVDWLDLIQWSLDQFKQAFSPESMKKIEAFHICGTWGDPILNKDIFEICQYIIDNSSAEILINTNGSIRSEEWWWDLAVMCRKRLKVVFAIDGSTQEIHSQYRQLTNLNMILNNMSTLAYGGSKSSVFTVVFEHNQHDLGNIIDLVKKYGATSIVFVESNRFYGTNTFSQSFIDNTNKPGQLRKTTLGPEVLSQVCNRKIRLRDQRVVDHLKGLTNVS